MGIFILLGLNTTKTITKKILKKFLYFVYFLVTREAGTRLLVLFLMPTQKCLSHMNFTF